MNASEFDTVILESSFQFAKKQGFFTHQCGPESRLTGWRRCRARRRHGQRRRGLPPVRYCAASSMAEYGGANRHLFRFAAAGRG
jgi:hypothetical protein